MVKKGSITIFLALVLSLIVSLVCSGINSARMAAARTQILNGVDIGLYSLFGQYDKTLLEEYDLFFLDGSYGKGTLDTEAVYKGFEEYMLPVLRQQNTQKLKVEQGELTGYILATDKNGQIFYQQAVKYMKETLGIQGVQLLLEKIKNQGEYLVNAENQGKQLENNNTLENYENEIHLANERRRAAEEAAREAERNGTSQGNTNLLPATPAPSVKVENPIPVIKNIKKMNLLNLVLPSGKLLSNKAVEKSSLVSGRKLQKGMNIELFPLDVVSSTDHILYQSYLSKKMGSFQNPSDRGLAYELEYILWGKSSDEKNLKEMAEKLLLIREGINLTCLLSDSAKMAQIKALSAAIAAMFMFPPAEPVLEAALILCWSFAESVLDVRELFAGGKVPLVKRSGEWQISLEKLTDFLNCLDSSRQSSETGMSYEDYLQVLLFSKDKDTKIMRGMDMLELSLREKEGFSNFQFDSCISALEISIDVNANKMKTYNVIRQYCYD